MQPMCFKNGSLHGVHSQYTFVEHIGKYQIIQHVR